MGTLWIIAASAAAVPAVLAAVLFLMYKRIFRGFSPVDTGSLGGGVFAVRDRYVNLYLIENCAGGFTAVDAGISPESVGRELAALGISPEAVTAVFLTHSDFDHTGGLSLFSRAEVFLAEEEMRMIDGTTARGPGKRNSVPGPVTSLPAGTVLERDGLTVSVVPCPGHTPGSVSYLIKGSLLFTGDSISLKDGKARPFVRFFNMNNTAQRESMARLAGLDGVGAVFTGHYGMVRNSLKC